MESTYSDLILHDVAWTTYQDLRDGPGNDRIRMTYLDGTLVLMSPEYIHDRDTHLFDLLVLGIAEGLGLEVLGCRSATLRRAGDAPTKGSGKEPDTAFYIGENERRMRRNISLDLAIDPPPDLAIEVINKSDSEIMLATYARIGVPEVWRYEVRSNSLWFGRLAGDTYEGDDRSVLLPKLTPALVLEALAAKVEGDMGELAWLRWLSAWARGLPEPPAAG